MERREFIALLGFAAAAMPANAHAEPIQPPDSLAVRLVGTWSFASSVNTRKDGSTFDRWGANPAGIFMFDRGGRYSQIILGSESRVFGAKTYCSFGSYSVDETNKHLITRIEACSVAKFSGTVQRREILLLNADQMKYSNPLTATGSTAEVLWKRVT